VIETKFIEQRQVVLIKCSKALLVLSRVQFVEALRRGKAYRRRMALNARMPHDTGGASHEATRDVTHHYGQDV
jgi:hypothetical protein